MAKKKQKKQQGQQFLSPEQYIKQKARTLEIGACYVSDGLETMGEGHIIVSRKRRRQEVLDDIINPDYAGHLDDCILDIHDRFEDMRRRFAKNNQDSW